MHFLEDIGKTNNFHNSYYVILYKEPRILLITNAVVVAEVEREAM
jgi:hypothetical protein